MHSLYTFHSIDYNRIAATCSNKASSRQTSQYNLGWIVSNSTYTTLYRHAIHSCWFDLHHGLQWYFPSVCFLSFLYTLAIDVCHHFDSICFVSHTCVTDSAEFDITNSQNFGSAIFFKFFYEFSLCAVCQARRCWLIYFPILVQFLAMDL